MTTSPDVTLPELLASALGHLGERGWVAGDYTDDDTGRVDLLGALRLAAGVHPREMPDPGAVLDVLLAAEDALAVALGADPAEVDAGEAVALWQDTVCDGAYAAARLLWLAFDQTGSDPVLSGVRISPGAAA
jgi:hypothetical protein